MPEHKHETHPEEKPEVHHTHAAHKTKFRIKKLNLLWMIIAVLSIMLVISLVTCGFRTCPAAEKEIKNTAVSTANQFLYGNENSKVKIVEYSDFQCPFCARAVPMIKQIEQGYNADQVSIEFKQFPLSFHANSQKAAEASECARDQGKFAEYHDKLFANQGALDANSLKKYAQEFGLDTGKFNSCFDNGEKKAKVQSDFNQGIQAGVTGTPSFFINGKIIVGACPYTTFEAVVNAEIAGKSWIVTQCQPTVS
jgi:protein-disulfide isomerase